MFSLPDWAFYPIAALTIGGMVAIALSFGDSGLRTPEEILSEGIAYEGEALNGLVAGNGLDITVQTDDSEMFARIAAARGPLDGAPSAGAFFALSPDETAALEGHRVRVSYHFRSAQTHGAAQTRIAFFADGIGQSAWQIVPLGNETAEAVIEISPPRCAWGQAYIGVWPDWEFEANQLELLRVEIRAIEAQDC